MTKIIDFPAPRRGRVAPDTAATLRADADSLTQSAAQLRRHGAIMREQAATMGDIKAGLDAEQRRGREIAAMAAAIERAIEAGDIAALLALQPRAQALAYPSTAVPDAAD